MRGPSPYRKTWQLCCQYNARPITRYSRDYHQITAYSFYIKFLSVYIQNSHEKTSNIWIPETPFVSDDFDSRWTYTQPRHLLKNHKGNNEAKSQQIIMTKDYSRQI